MNCRIVCLVHDLDSLRQLHHAWTLEQEISRLNVFDLVIVHNEQMMALLTARGLKTKMSCLELFDYLVPDKIQEIISSSVQHRVTCSGLRKHIVFAGNLSKSGFVDALRNLPALHFNLYGRDFKGPATEQLQWAGIFDADELPAKIAGDFGLIWDGDDLDKCSGQLGNYLKYNNPHKASLYLLAQLPLLAPKDTAIGNFIDKHKIGLTVNSLYELPDLIAHLNEASYQNMKANIVEISAKIAAGGFLKKQVELL